MALKRYIHFIFLVTSCSVICYGQCGKVIKVSDGDTFIILLNNHKILKVRVAYVDCPEHGQEYGTEATQYTTRLLMSSIVCFEIKYFDRYKRAVSLVRLSNGKLLNEELIKQGFAWQYLKYSKDKKLATLELMAKNNCLGLWRGQKPIPPWIWRKHHYSYAEKKI